MHSRYLKSFILSLLSVLTLTACGGGGGGSTPAVVNTPPTDLDAFSLLPAKSLAASTSTFNLSGRDNTGTQYSATLTIINTPNIGNINGKVINRVQSNVTLINTTADPDVTATTSGSSYYTSDYILSYIVDEDNQITCTPIQGTYMAPPDSAKVNDNGSLATLTCADKDKVPTNTAIVITWRLDAGATADEAKFVVTQASSVSGNPDSTEVDSYIIDHAGNIKSIEVVVTKGVIIRTLSGPKLTQ